MQVNEEAGVIAVQLSKNSAYVTTPTTPDQASLHSSHYNIDVGEASEAGNDQVDYGKDGPWSSPALYQRSIARCRHNLGRALIPSRTFRRVVKGANDCRALQLRQPTRTFLSWKRANPPHRVL